MNIKLKQILTKYMYIDLLPPKTKNLFSWQVKYQIVKKDQENLRYFRLNVTRKNTQQNGFIMFVGMKEQTKEIKISEFKFICLNPL